MRLPDPQFSYAVLIGTSTYRSQEFADLPAVRNNLDGLAEVLTDPALGGLPADHCIALPDPTDVRAVFQGLQRYAALAEDTLLVYFAGHGLLDERHHDDLYLARADTQGEELPVSALSIQLMRRVFLNSLAVNKILMLDCCFSGRASAPHMSGPDEAILGQVGIDGTYTLTATSATGIALAPIGAPHTAFTGELLTLVRTGIPNGPELLTLATIYRQLLRALTARGLPKPQQLNTGTAEDLALTRNPAHGDDHDKKEPRPPRPQRSVRTRPPLAATPITAIRTKMVHSLSFSPDGRGLAVATGTNTVRVFETSGWRQRLAVRQRWQGQASVYAVAFSPSGHEFATGDSIIGGGLVQMWDASTGSRRRKLALGAGVWAVVFSPDGEWLATGDTDGNVQIWNALFGKPLITVSHSDWVNGVAFSPDRRRFATSGRDRTARIWDVYTGEPKAILIHDYGVRAVAFSSDGRLLATAGTSAQVWDAQTGTKLFALSQPESLRHLCTDIAFNPNSRFLAAAYIDHTARIWDTNTSAELLKLNHDHEVRAVAFSPDGRLLATGDGQWPQDTFRDGPGTVHVWQLEET